MLELQGGQVRFVPGEVNGKTRLMCKARLKDLSANKGPGDRRLLELSCQGKHQEVRSAQA